jgi:hypothetical protein
MQIGKNFTPELGPFQSRHDGYVISTQVYDVLAQVRLNTARRRF